MRSFVIAVAVSLVAALAGSPAQAQNGQKNGRKVPSPPLPPVIEMRAGFAVVLHAPADVATAIVGNQNLIDVVPLRTSAGAFAITARVPGSTNLILLGPDGAEVYSGFVNISGRSTTGEIQVHNNPREVAGYTVHNCNPGCSLVGRVIAGRINPITGEDMTDPPVYIVGAPPTAAGAPVAPAPVPAPR